MLVETIHQDNSKVGREDKLIEMTKSLGGRIQEILSGHDPPLEPEIKEYLENILADVNISAPPDDNEREALKSTLEQFVNEQECGSILSLLSLEASSPQQESVKKSSTPPKPQMLGDCYSSSAPISPTSRDKTPEGEPSEQDPKNNTQKDLRKQRRQAKRKGGKKVAPSSHDPQHANSASATSSELFDDHASAWKERQEDGQLWGGRGHGGRGVQFTGENYDNIHLPSVSLQFEGNELLVDSSMDIVRGHRYGLLGRNGVGKSTLLRQLAARAIPGIPHGMRIILCQQQIQGREDQTALEALVEADTDRTALLQEMEEVESQIEQGIDLEENAQRLGDIVAELDVIDADGAEGRAEEILRGLSFTTAMINGPTASLSKYDFFLEELDQYNNQYREKIWLLIPQYFVCRCLFAGGGWRMRLALAKALFVPYADLILLDECTNHLDLHGMDWLIRYLTKADSQQERTLMVVSHDRSFLDAICTDIVVMEHHRLSYHVGNYSEYQRQMQDKAARQAQILDASERQRNKAMAFVQKQQNSKKSTDPNKQRQAKMIRDKKLDRIGNYREDGKKFKQFSLKTMDESSVRLAQKVHIERDSPVLKLQFPNPTWPPGVSEGSPLVQFDGVSFGYDAEGDPLLKDLTLNIVRGSKIALVGNNGCGKTTLVKMIAGELENKGKTTGTLWRHPSLRIGHVTQYSVEELEDYAHMTVVQYAEEKLSTGRASSTVIKEASGNVRQYLGSFGLGGAHAHRPIGSMSGGERMRLCFATILADEPHMLMLDESTNHVDLETLDSMSTALSAYQGAVLMVSHNQAFLSGFCKELWVLEHGRVDVSHNDTESFDELFSSYRDHILSSSAASDRRQERRAKTIMAKRATKQDTGAQKNTTLFA